MREIVNMGAEGGVCIVGSGSTHGHNMMRLPKREREREAAWRQPAIVAFCPHQKRDFVDYLLAVFGDFRHQVDLIVI